MRTRRELLRTAAAAIATPAARAQHRHGESALVPLGESEPYKPAVFTPEQMEWVAKLVDAIIPRTDTPGASDAGVPVFIDRALSRDKRKRARFLEGMARLDDAARQQYGAGFAASTPGRQTALLAALESDPASPGGRFFKLVKDLTIDGYYTSKPGLTVELDWHANTFLPEFKGCTHPEHQG